MRAERLAKETQNHQTNKQLSNELPMAHAPTLWGRISGFALGRPPAIQKSKAGWTGSKAPNMQAIAANNLKTNKLSVRQIEITDNN